MENPKEYYENNINKINKNLRKNNINFCSAKINNSNCGHSSNVLSI